MFLPEPAYSPVRGSGAPADPDRLISFPIPGKSAIVQFDPAAACSLRKQAESATGVNSGVNYGLVVGSVRMKDLRWITVQEIVPIVTRGAGWALSGLEIPSSTIGYYTLENHGRDLPAVELIFLQQLLQDRSCLVIRLASNTRQQVVASLFLRDGAADFAERADHQIVLAGDDRVPPKAARKETVLPAVMEEQNVVQAEDGPAKTGSSANRWLAPLSVLAASCAVIWLYTQMGSQPAGASAGKTQISSGTSDRVLEKRNEPGLSTAQSANQLPAPEVQRSVAKTGNTSGRPGSQASAIKQPLTVAQSDQNLAPGQVETTVTPPPSAPVETAAAAVPATEQIPRVVEPRSEPITSKEPETRAVAPPAPLVARVETPSLPPKQVPEPTPATVPAPSVTAPPTPAPPTAASYVGPRVIRRVAPTMPPAATAMPLMGTQIDVTVQIDPKGSVTDARISAVRGAAAALLGPESLRAARLFRFEPARRNQQNVESSMVLTFSFVRSQK